MYMYVLCIQATVDTEVRLLTTEMLHLLLRCFMELTGGAKKEKPALIVSTTQYSIMVHSCQWYVSCQGHCVANMLALLELMTPRHYQVLRASFETAADLEVSSHTHCDACV